MKYFKTQDLYKARNVSFNHKKIQAFSYSWWQFVKVIKGQVIFNDYRYSNSTCKHQSKVRSLMHELGIKIDRTVSFKTGLQEVSTIATLNKLQKEQDQKDTETEELKRIERNKKAKARRLAKKLEDYLENQVHFRDYDIVSKQYFGNPGYTISTKIAVHQVVEDVEHDVENALHSFRRDGFGSIVFYVEGL